MSGPTSTLLAAALLAGASLLARAVYAADACLPEAVAAAVTDCTGAASMPALPVAALLQLAAQGPASTITAGARASRRNAPFPEPRDFDAVEAHREAAYHRFVCEDRPASGDTKAWEQHLEIAYARARLHFGASHAREAAVLLREVALRGSSTETGVYATQLYLEALNVLGAHGAPACYDDMARDVPTFVGLHCKDGKDRAHPEACAILDRIERDILRLHAEQRVRDAERSGDPATGYEASAALFLDLWTRHLRGPCEAKQATCERAEEVLYNAARAYQAARDVEKAIAVRRVLLDPRYHLESTELARRAVYEIGALRHAMASYDEAATWYERFARTSPKLEKAPEALQDAVLLRLALGQEELADGDGELYLKTYGSSKPAQAATVVFAIGAHHIEEEDWGEARKRLAAAMSLVDRSAPLDVQIQAHALLGRALAKLGKTAAATAEYEKVRASWSDPAAVVGKIMETSDHRKLAKALAAKGEAAFFFAEEKRRAALAVKLPPYTGSGRHEDMARYLATTAATWLADRRKAIDEAEKAYVEVLTIQPMPPPRWVVASVARVAEMHGALSAELGSAPAPRGWKKQGPSPWGRRWEEVWADWQALRMEARAPALASAKKVYQRCATLSVTYQWSDEGSHACATWLSEHYPAEYPRLDELLGKPVWRASGIESQPVLPP